MARVDVIPPERVGPTRVPSLEANEVFARTRLIHLVSFSEPVDKRLVNEAVPQLVETQK